MTVSTGVTALDVKRLPVILDRLEARLAADRDALERCCARAGVRVSHAAAAWAEARDEVQRLDDLADAIEQHRSHVCAVRPEDCWLLAPHLAHYAAALAPVAMLSMPVEVDVSLPDNVIRIFGGDGKHIDITVDADSITSATDPAVRV